MSDEGAVLTMIEDAVRLAIDSGVSADRFKRLMIDSWDQVLQDKRRFDAKELREALT